MKTRDPSGFTLIELVLALSIFSLLAVAIYSTFSVGIKARDKGENASELFQEARLILDRLASEARNMIEYSSYEFTGETDRVSFPTLVREGDHLEICYVTYWLEADQDDGSKVVKRQAVRRFADQTETNLSSSSAEMSFEYAYRDAAGESLHWVDSWDSSVEEGHPAAIRVRLSLVHEDEQTTSFTRVIHLPMGLVL